MNFSSVLISSIIASIMLSGNFYYSTSLIEHSEEITENNNLQNVKDSVIEYYNIKGSLPSDFGDVEEYISYTNFIGTKDKYDNNFSIVKNSDDSTFEFNGIKDKYLLSIVAIGGDKTLDTKIDSNNKLQVLKDEKIIILNNLDLKESTRGKTLTKLSLCKSAYTTYLNNNSNTDPNDVFDLVSGNYLLPLNAYDEYGNILLIDTNDNDCYSKGFNNTNDNKSLDDIFL